MKLEHILIKGFRSISEAALSSCGGFNVIIGKNNAGKSNVLLAIDAFFACLRGGEPLFLDPPIGREIDWHEKNSNIPIEIGMVFQLSLSERDNLIQNIVSESPQVKNVADGMDTELRLGILLRIPFASKPFAFVKKMVLSKDAKTTFAVDGAFRPILEVGDQAASELAVKEQKIRQHEQSATELKDIADRIQSHMDEDDWTRLKSDQLPLNVRRRYIGSSFLYTGSMSADMQAQIEELIRSSETRTAFKEAALAISSRHLKEVQTLKSEALKNRVDTFAGQVDFIPKYARELLKQVSETKVLYLTERRDPIGKREAAQLLELKVKRGGPEKLRYIQETVSTLLGVQIDAFQAEMRSGNEAPAELDVDQFLVQVNGAGIREALRLILDFEFRRPNILLVEEPEIHLHPALETSMMRYLKHAGSDSQIFITTHSTNFLDTAEMRNVYLASKDVSTRLQLIDHNEAEVSIPRELGIRLSSLFMFDRLVFVEGPSDEDVFREWASTMKVNFGNASVAFIPMGGVRNLAHYAAEKTISFLTKRQVKMWFLLDHDERDDTEIKQMARQLGTQAKLHILKRREIENYLIASRPLVEFIKQKRGMAGFKEQDSVSEQSVRDSLLEQAESLKQVAIERRVIKEICRPLYPNRKALQEVDNGTSLSTRIAEDIERQKMVLSLIESSINQSIEEKTKAVNENWDSRKYEIVPGDILLDKMCQTFGVRFNKDRDSARLASLMKENEIDQEIKSIIGDICQQ